MKKYVPSASIVVCTFNRGERINPCLESLRRQTYPKDRYEIIVVDDASTDNTRDIIDARNVRLIRHDVNRGIPSARNTGLAAAKGDIVVYIDDDAVADPRWLEHLMEPFAVTDVVATGGRTFAYKTEYIAERYLAANEYGNPAPLAFGKSKNPLWRFLVYIKNMFAPVAVATNLVEVQAVFGLNCAYRTAALRAIGGFDETLHADEDSEVSTRLRSMGARIVFIPTAVIYHRHRESVRKLIRQTYYRAEYTVLYYAKEKKILPIFPLPLLYIALAITLLFIHPIIIDIAVIACGPLALYSWWPIKAFRRRDPEYFLYAYIQLALESAAIAGIVRGSIRSKNNYGT